MSFYVVSDNLECRNAGLFILKKFIKEKHQSQRVIFCAIIYKNIIIKNIIRTEGSLSHKAVSPSNSNFYTHYQAELKYAPMFNVCVQSHKKMRRLLILRMIR